MYWLRWAVGSSTACRMSGRLSYFVVDAARGLAEVRIWWPRMMIEAWNIGAGSLFIVMLISAFAGAVTALQTGYQFTGSIPILRRRYAGCLLDHPGARPGADRAHPGRPDRRPLCRRARAPCG